MFSITLGLTKASIHMQMQQLYNYYDKVNTLQSIQHYITLLVEKVGSHRVAWKLNCVILHCKESIQLNSLESYSRPVSIYDLNLSLQLAVVTSHCIKLM